MKEDSKLLSEDVKKAIEKLLKVKKEITFDIPSPILSKLPPHVLKTVLKLKKQVKIMNLKINAAEKIRESSPDKKTMKRIDEVLEIDPDKTLKASLTPEELMQLRYKKKND